MAPTNRHGKSATPAVSQFQGQRATLGFHDEMIVEGLQPKRRPWAKAFKEVLGVGTGFYVDADGQRKDWLEAHYIELATHDTPKGRKAKKVVAIVVAEQLAPDVNMFVALHSADNDFKTFANAVSKQPVLNHQLDMYRYLYGDTKK